LRERGPHKNLPSPSPIAWCLDAEPAFSQQRRFVDAADDDDEGDGVFDDKAETDEGEVDENAIMRE